jgi:serine/threonine-protein kinase
MTLGATVPGVILGTAAYMSPEQVRGKSVDQRADIWAFGVVLFELLTAKQLFRGDDLAETLASVVKEQPDLRAVPKRIHKVMKACLEKDPKQRLRSIGDLHYLLEAEPAAAKHPRLTAVLATVAGVLLVALGIGSLFYVRRPPAERPVVRFQIPAPEEKVSINKFMALSPDGHRLALTLTGRMEELRSGFGRSIPWKCESFRARKERRPLPCPSGRQTAASSVSSRAAS